MERHERLDRRFTLLGLVHALPDALALAALVLHPLDRGLTPPAVAGLFAVYGGGAIVAGVAVAALGTHDPRQRLTLGSMLAGIGWLVFALAPDFTWFVVAALVLAAGRGAGAGALADWLRAAAPGVSVRNAGRVGAVVGAALGGGIAAIGILTVPWLGYGLAALAACVATILDRLVLWAVASGAAPKAPSDRPAPALPLEGSRLRTGVAIGAACGVGVAGTAVALVLPLQILPLVGPPVERAAIVGAIVAAALIAVGLGALAAPAAARRRPLAAYAAVAAGVGVALYAGAYLPGEVAPTALLLACLGLGLVHGLHERWLVGKRAHAALAWVVGHLGVLAGGLGSAWLLEHFSVDGALSVAGLAWLLCAVTAVILLAFDELSGPQRP